MKAERRHELKHNELADWLGERMEMLKPHATGVLLGIVLLAVILIGSAWYLGGKNQAASRAWSRYFQAFNDREPQKTLDAIAGDQSGSKAAWWAKLAVADMDLGKGAAMLYSDRAEATKLLQQAKDGYSRVEAADDPMLKSRARLGLAKVHESLCNVEEAQKYYELVAKDATSPAIAKAAAADAERLKDKEEAEFLEWFAKQTPKRPAPLPGMGGTVPGLPGDLPSRPNIGLTPGVLEGVGTETATDAGTGLPPTTPGLPPPADAPAAGTEKKSDVPADEAKPAAPPAETKPDEAASSPGKAEAAPEAVSEKKSE
jgi:hypothetical protein